MNQAIVAAYMACMSFTQHGFATDVLDSRFGEARPLWSYVGPRAADCDKIQIEYLKQWFDGATERQRAKAAATDAAIRAGLKALPSH